MITYDEFKNWHTANGLDTVSYPVMLAAWEVYRTMYIMHGADYANEKICGHEVWNMKDGDYQAYLEGPHDPRD